MKKCLLFIAMSAALPVGAQARDVSNIEDVSLEELLGGDTTVASTKSMQLRASPGAITMITREEILRHGARDLADILPLIPGFDLGSDVTGVLGISFRGNWALEGKALVLVDGIEMNETQYLNVPMGNHFPLDDVDRIEVLRGPGSVRYGGNAELCVINIITRTGAQKSGAEVSLTYAQAEDPFANGSSGASVGGTLPVLGGLDLSLHASLGRLSRSDRRYTDVFGSSFDMSHQQQIRAAWINAAATTPWLKARLVLDGYFLDDRTGYDELMARPTTTGFPAGYLELASPWQLTPTLSFNARLVLQRQLPWWTPAPESEYIGTRNDRARARLVLAWQALPALALSTGVDGTTEAVLALERAEAGEQHLDLFNDKNSGDGVTNLYTGSWWGEALLETPLFTLTTGARAELHNIYGAAVVPRVALTRVFGPAHAKLLVSGAYKAPGPANLELAPDIRPERTRVLEAEVGVELVPDSYLTMNFFDIDINDPIVYFVSEVNDAEGYTNYPRTGSRGVELQALWSPRFGRFDVSWTFASAEGKNEVDSYAIPGVTSRLLAQPAHKVALMAALFLTDKVSFTPSAVLRSERAAVTAVDAAGASIITDLPPSLLVNAFLDVRDVIPHVNLGVGIQNLLADPYTVPQPYDSQHAPLPALDRTVVVRVGGTFALQ